MPEGNILSYTYNGALMASESGMVTGTALDTVTTTQTYNQFGEIETYDAGDYSYAVTARDKLGRITEKSETIEGVTTTYQYTYDRVGRLETVWENGLFVSQYTYDSNGNRTSHNATSATYNDQDMMLSYGDNSYTYTANGDLMVKTDTVGTTTYTHDALGNLEQVNLPNNDVISYTYDGRNRLISKQVNGVTEYRLIYAGQLSPVAKVDGSGNTIETYIYGLGVNSPDYILKDGTKYRVIKDHLGSIRMIVNTSTGEVVKTLRYSEFGEITEETGTFDTIFGFAGGIRDIDTGFTKFGARWYDPSTGRWMEKEPLGFRGAMNFYSYAGNDPINFYDLNGYLSERAQELVDYYQFLYLDDPKEAWNQAYTDRALDEKEKRGNGGDEMCIAWDLDLRDAEHYLWAYYQTNTSPDWAPVPIPVDIMDIISAGYSLKKYLSPSESESPASWAELEAAFEGAYQGGKDRLLGYFGW